MGEKTKEERRRASQNLKKTKSINMGINRARRKGIREKEKKRNVLPT